MFVAKKTIPRRTVLRGLGVTLALPWLDAMVPAFTAFAKSEAAPPRRFGVFYVPNGMSMGYWLPKSEGALSELPPTLQSLATFKDRVTLIGGLAGDAANKVKGAGAHSRSSGTFLTCVPFQAITDANVIAATTMDQLVAKAFGKDTELKSIELGLESADILGACDGASCALTNTIAWSAPSTPLPIENDPRSVFERLFGLSGSTDPAARQARLRRNQSMLDVLTRQIARLNTALGPRDQAKFDEYLEGIRDVEQRIQKAEQQNARELPVVNQPIGIPTDYNEHATLMMDLLVLAYQTDLTRVSTFMLAREVSSRAYPEIGVSDSHHPLSHHANEPAKLERLHKVNEYHFRQFAHLVDRLAAIPEGDGTMFDHSLFLYGTGISDSNTHFYDDLPIALVSGKNVAIDANRYVRYPQGTPLANLHVALLEKLGVEVERFGDSNGKLPLVQGSGLTGL
jgi:Protein of unknown function (DUF1552)